MDFKEEIMMGTFDVQNDKEAINVSLNEITGLLTLCLWFISYTNLVLYYIAAEAIAEFRGSCKENVSLYIHV